METLCKEASLKGWCDVYVWKVDGENNSQLWLVNIPIESILRNIFVDFNSQLEYIQLQFRKSIHVAIGTKVLKKKPGVCLLR